MGQYWYPVNLTKREFIHPHKLASGLKLWEQVAAHPGTGAALIVLMAAMPEPRGGGDLELPDDVAKRTVGRWAGDRVALVGDYAEDGDLKGPLPIPIKEIFSACSDGRWKDISEDVAAVLSRELEGRYDGPEGSWKQFVGQ